MTQHEADLEALTADLKGAQNIAWDLMDEAPTALEKDALFNVGYNVGLALRMLEHAASRPPSRDFDVVTG